MGRYFQIFFIFRFICYPFFIFTIYGIILPIDFHIFQRGRYTTNQLFFMENPKRKWMMTGITPG